MKKTMLKTITLLVGFSLIISGCSLLPSSGPAVKATNVTLTFWGVFDTSDAYAGIIAAYTQSHPNITVVYKKLLWEEYEKELLNAWAEDRGPDIFLIHNSWVGEYQTKLEPMPATIKVPILITQKSAFKTTQTASLLTSAGLTPKNIKDNFLPTVYYDVVRNNKIWGLPLAVDNLVLFYNQRLLDLAGIGTPPATWAALQAAVAKITAVSPGDKNQIIRSAIAMGTANNNNRAFDILSLMLLQSGGIVLDVNGKPSSSQPDVVEKTLLSYLSYFYPTEANRPKYTNSTWNDSLAMEATDAFIQGKLAMMFGYLYQLPYLKAQAPSIDIGVAGVPHTKETTIQNDQGETQTVLSDTKDGEAINLASYWLLTVAKKSKHINEAWDFINFAATGSFTDPKDNKKKFRAESYLMSGATISSAVIGRTPALRVLWKTYLNDEKFKPAIDQALTAKSWYRGNNPAQAEQIFESMINTYVISKKDARTGANLLNQAFR
jgi:ABC-type glycerol-3-phosphate transport system substrate-binding protein